VPLEHIKTRCLLPIKHNDLLSFHYLNIATCLNKEKKISGRVSWIKDILFL
jgi:hypothetical protein